MRFIALLIFFAFMALAANAEDNETSETVIATPPSGPVRGSVMKSRLGKKFYSFRGVRFADAPVGEKRFKAPVPAAPWVDTFDATKEGPGCPQPLPQLQSEDCLLLNVYTSKLPSAGNSSNYENPKRPVIVFFHPGIFYYFSGQSLVQGPKLLLDQDIVLVTINYRLGTLGFLATGDARAPGNLALKDQVVGLRWVKNNIASFGGDPNSVTIAGYSSGAWSVVLHLLSPMSKGLFHRAIAMSNYPVWHQNLPMDQNDLAKKQAENVGCPTNSTDVIIACLKTKSAHDIAWSLSKFFDWRTYPTLLWMPVVEPEIPGVESFLTAQPVDLIKQGKIHPVPFMTGLTKDEFASEVINLVEAARKGNSSEFELLNDNWEKLGPILVGYERDTPKSKEISKTLRETYLKNQPINLQNVDNLADILRDVYGFAGHRLVNLMAQHSKEPVYFYEFTYQGRYSFAVWHDTNKPYGVGYHDDMLYLFDNSYLPSFKETDPEVPTIERMTSIWANFAKSGVPISSNNALFENVTWTQFTPEHNKYLEMGEKFVMRENFRPEKMAIWDRLFPIETATKK